MDPFLPHPLIFSTTHSSSSSSSSTTTTTNYIDPMFSGLTFQTLLSLNPSLFSSSLSDHHPPPPLPPPPPFNLFHHHRRSDPPPCRAVIPHMRSNLARQRRQKLSEKTRCLQKLMPWDTKMDQATLLQHAYKYVNDLERLNRNQLLQVLVNSPVAQTMLCSQGFCVFSMEHLFLLTKDISFSQPDHHACFSPQQQP
ncbi:PREDICTED: transcription factor HEC3-like [Lupinus angustifolius]|uniref:transcription factor HEC3-like n=1 Tax=Lupinus angustifolius TaxID=3871 RepID=UPI00092E99A1|nr:PREDICTED: transcription factor HEC3-like [Lupinus angustifolius]